MSVVDSGLAALWKEKMACGPNNKFVIVNFEISVKLLCSPGNLYLICLLKILFKISGLFNLIQFIICRQL